MRERYFLLLWICAIWLQLSASAPIVDPISEKILPITRVLVAVTVQHEICLNEHSALAIVGELINFDKKELAATLRMKLAHQSKQLSDAFDFIDKLPSLRAQNAQKTMNGLGALSKLKQQESLMNRQSFKNPTEALKSAVGLRRTLMTADVDFNKEYFKKVGDALIKIERSTATDGNTEEFDILSTLKDKADVALHQLRLIQTYETTYSELFLLSDLETRTFKYMNLSKTMGEVGKSYGDIMHLDSMAPALAVQSTVLQSHKEIFDKYQKQFTETSSSLNVINQLLKSKSDKVSTNGFPNGLDDLKRVEKDFDSSSFLGVIVQDRDATNIKNALIPLTNTSKSLDLLENDRKKLSLDANILNDFQDFLKLFSDVVDASNHASKNQDFENSLQNLVECVTQLKPVQSSHDFKKLDVIGSYVGIVVKKRNAFKNVMTELNEQKDLEQFVAAFDEMDLMTRYLPNAHVAVETVNVWNNIRGLKVYESWKHIFDLIQQFDPDPFYFGTVDFNIDLFEEIMTSAETMNLFDTVKCLPSAFPDIHTLLDSGRKIEEIKKQKSHLTDAIFLLSNAQNFKLSAENAIDEMKEISTEGDAQFICDLPDDFGKMMGPLISGGSLANEFLMIRDSEKSMKNVANPSPLVKAAAEAVPKADTIYNDGFRKEILELLERVKSQLKTVESMPAKTLDGIFNIFSSLSKVKGFAPENFKVIREIAEELSQNSIQEVKTAAKDFETVSNLHMDFAAYSTNGSSANDVMNYVDLLFRESE